MVGREAKGPRIRVGTAGWDYPDWSGFVYPSAAGRRFDKLAWIGRFVDVIEINSSFYRPVRPAVAESWVLRTADLEGFTFTAKAHRSWTHETDSNPEQTVPATLRGLQPLRDAGRFGALLIQFPQSFHYSDRSLARLDRLLDLVGDWPAVVEVRHSGWNTEPAFEWFAERGVGWCLVDQPGVGHSTVGAVDRVTSKVAYARLHGRNAKNWFRAEAGRDERYDYLYTPDELERLVPALKGMAAQAEELFVIQNNHFRGQALANALQMKQMMQGGAPEAPEELVAAYPELSGRVRVKRRRLF